MLWFKNTTSRMGDSRSVSEHKTFDVCPTYRAAPRCGQCLGTVGTQTYVTAVEYDDLTRVGETDDTVLRLVFLSIRAPVGAVCCHLLALSEHFRVQRVHVPLFLLPDVVLVQHVKHNPGSHRAAQPRHHLQRTCLRLQQLHHFRLVVGGQYVVSRVVRGAQLHATPLEGDGAEREHPLVQPQHLLRLLEALRHLAKDAVDAATEGAGGVRLEVVVGHGQCVHDQLGRQRVLHVHGDVTVWRYHAECGCINSVLDDILDVGPVRNKQFGV